MTIRRTLLILMLAVGLWGAMDEVSYASCETRTALGTYPNLTYLGVDLCDTSGSKQMTLTTCLSGESTCIATSPASYIMVQPVAKPTNGATPVAYISAGATEDEHAVCTAPCNLYSITATNTNAAVRYLKCENDTVSGTAPGTDTPEFRMAIPPAHAVTTTFPVGKYFSTALTCWLVTGAADSDVAEVAANELMVNYDIAQ